MNTQRFSNTNKNLRSGALTLLAFMLFSSSVHAEAPMNTDDAGTLNKGSMKVEGGWQRDENQRGGELLFGFSPIKNFEMEVAASHAKDVGDSTDNKLRGASFGAKWVPYQNETGWSLGARFDYGHTRITDRCLASERYTEREYAVTGLASFRLTNGQVLHTNLGFSRTKSQGESETISTWSIGYEFPLHEKLQLTVETFGVEHSNPDKAIGLRYEISDDLKVSAGFGRGNDRNFGQAGFAWEF